ncbi:MAG: ABC transporter ATP-binding protein [Kofleriaceae bacterium]|nr:ABC transporter ATP-binding protein [Kofleriaceae bacterium]MCL4228034.1 ABC transporter ATP-binding protein [Myxococcales bacterium]
MEIELRQVSKRFARTTALRGVDLTIARGARVALLGPNGSGKTTLTRAIMGLLRTEGSILIDGRPLTDRMTIAPRLAYVPQIAPQMAAAVDEIVGVVCELRGLAPAAVAEIAADLGLDLAAVRGRALRNLSGGMRQKLLLAIALATPAELLILDEPTASLDAAARARFLARFAAIASGATVILCSHRLDELRSLVDHVVVLSDGTVAHDGPAAAYLSERLAAVIEVRCRDGAPPWLAQHGFARGVGGWWSRAVTPAEKLTLVPAALAALGGEVDDLVVRDADRLELTPEVRHVA